MRKVGKAAPLEREAEYKKKVSVQGEGVETPKVTGRDEVEATEPIS